MRRARYSSSISGSLVRTESVGWTRTSLTTPSRAARMLCSIFMASTTQTSGRPLRGRGADQYRYDTARHGGAYDVLFGARWAGPAGGGWNGDAGGLGAAAPRARLDGGQALHLDRKSLAFDGDLHRGLAQVTDFYVVPVVADSNPKSGYGQPRLPRVRERSCSRRPWIRQALDAGTGEGVLMAIAIATPMAAAISLSGLWPLA